MRIISQCFGEKGVILGGWLFSNSVPFLPGPSPSAPSDVYLLLLLRDTVGDRTCGTHVLMQI